METILSIAGKPGLYRLVSRGKQNLIVESLDKVKKRIPVFATDRVTSLADIAMYTDADDIVAMNCTHSSQRCCPITTATAYTTETSRSSSSGITSSLRMDSLTLSRCLLRPRATMSMIVKNSK